MLVRLLYASRAADPAGATMDAILAQAREHNTVRGITGILCFGSGIYLQALEGGREAVNDLYGRIQRDARHRDVLLMNYEEISERRFGGWSMGQVQMNRINATILLKYAEKAEFDPYALSGRVALALLDELLATASIVGRS